MPPARITAFAVAIAALSWPAAAEPLSPDFQWGRQVHVFSPDDSRRLIETGWRLPARSTKAYALRLHVMMELARSLGHDAGVGALQATFGTPQESGGAPGRAAPADGADPARDWRLVNLDVTGDNAVDRADLNKARGGRGAGS